MKTIEKVLHILNIVLVCMMSAHLMGGWVLSWVFDALFFDAEWYVLLLCFTFGLERWVQVVAADSVKERIGLLISALLLTASGVHMLLAGILQPIDYHDDSLFCLACMCDALHLYVLPALIWVMVRLLMICISTPKGQKLVPIVDLSIVFAWFGYALYTWADGIARHGPGFYMWGGYYAGRVFIPVLLIVNVTLFLVRNVRETLQLEKA